MKAQDPRNILGSLAKQLALQDEDSFTKLQRVYKDKSRKDQLSLNFSLDELRDLVISMVSGFNDAMVIVDALDECDAHTKCVTHLLASLTAKGKAKNIKSLFLSRDEPDIRFSLADFVDVSIAASGADVKLFVSAEIESRIRNRELRIKDQSLKEEIMGRLVEGAEGM